MASNEIHPYRDLTTYVRIFKSALIFCMVIGLASIWSSWLQIELLTAIGDVTSDMIDANDQRESLIALVYLAVIIVTMILFFRWVYLANRNAHGLGARDMEFTPGWAVGWFGIPIANFWQPFKAMKEIFQASHPSQTDNWHHAEAPGLLKVWWGLWLAYSIIGRLRVSRLGDDFQTETVSAAQMDIYSDIAFVALLLLTLYLVDTLYDWQTEKHELIGEAVEAEAMAGQW